MERGMKLAIWGSVHAAFKGSDAELKSVVDYILSR